MTKAIIEIPINVTVDYKKSRIIIDCENYKDATEILGYILDMNKKRIS